MTTGTITVTVEVVKCRHHKADSGWQAVACRLDSVQVGEVPTWLRDADRNGGFAVTGVFGAKVAPGDLFDVEGRDDTNRWGVQLKAHTVMPVARKDDRALFSFLRRFPQVGPTRAKAIMDAFEGADEIFRLMEHEPERLAAVRGITVERATDISEAFIRMAGERDAWTFCRELALPGALTARIIDQMGAAARSRISADPFDLMTSMRISFRDCDLIREKLGWSEDHPLRIAAGALLVIQAASRDGHCWHAESDLFGQGVERSVEQARLSTGMSESHLRAGLQTLTEPLEISESVTRPPRVTIDDEGRIYLASLYAAERSVCSVVAALLRGDR